MADFKRADYGAIVLIWPVTEAAHNWIDENVVAEPWQWFGGALGVDHRFVPDILAAITEAGLKIQSA